MYFDKDATQKRIDQIDEERPTTKDVLFLRGYIRWLKVEACQETESRQRAIRARLDAEDKARWAEAETTELKMLLEGTETPDVPVSWAYDKHLGVQSALFINTNHRISCWLVFTLRESGLTQLEAICSTARRAAKYRRGFKYRESDIVDTNPIVKMWIEPSLINHLLGSTMYGQEM